MYANCSTIIIITTTILFQTIYFSRVAQTSTALVSLRIHPVSLEPKRLAHTNIRVRECPDKMPTTHVVSMKLASTKWNFRGISSIRPTYLMSLVISKQNNIWLIPHLLNWLYNRDHFVINLLILLLI